MKNHRYTLEPYKGAKTRHHCPKCLKKSVFTRYIDTESNTYLNDAVGCCNRIIKCGYHYKPKQYFSENSILFQAITKKITTTEKIKKPKTSYINPHIMHQSKSSKKRNNFLDFLKNHWNKTVATELAEKYNIGTSKYWNGATVFFQVDRDYKIRTGKIIQYNSSTGKRIKSNFPPANWVHTVLKLDNYNLEQCYFGEHLLNEDLIKPIAIVESEKTAVISSVYLPEFIWLSCGGINNLNEAKTRVLKGRNVVLFPDLNGFDSWTKKIPQLTKLATFKVSTLLEEKATEQEKELGLDIADYLINLDINFKNLLD
ncbi:DUF6371 domain-containing protein [Bizionia sp. M204]|uniref:DUF6371 domain-containing protein n=1 Tax=Bizionia sp. M204 TaxID=2675331 RepID=UPI002059F93D|nr:DUF6371 domain-containing protein [Bizionia sp. M204]UPS92828.1 hypothetical protein GMA17_14335 [Bizionia sp. M204]